MAPAPNPVAYVDNPRVWCDPWGLAPYPADGASNRERPPLEGDTNYVVDDPNDWSDTITEIDRVQGRVLWEEKSVTGQHPNMRIEPWVEKHVHKKLDSYVRARGHLERWEQAPIGLDFTQPGATPAFKKAVEEGVQIWRQNNPGVDVRVRWAQ